MTFSEDKIKRVSGGSARGGQFAHKQNSAPSASLAPASAPMPQVRLDSGDIMRTNENFRRSANKIARNFQIDPSVAEDITQESWLHLLERNARRGDLEARLNDPKFQTMVTKTLGKRLFGEGAEYGLRDTDYRARRQLAAAEQEFQDNNGRRMTGRERREKAAEIRLAFPAQGRPKPDYYEYKTRVSTDEKIGESDSTRGELIESSMRADWYDGATDYSAEYESHLDDLDDASVEKAEIRKRAWNIIAPANEVPLTKEGDDALQRKEAMKARSDVKAAGGARALAERWLDGAATDEEEAALFAPFQAAEERPDLLRERREIAMTIRRFPAGDKLWESATFAATTA